MLKNIETVSLPHVVPLLQNHGDISVLQQDNARPHIACDNIQFLRNNNIDFIDDWPSKSPDPNPIKHLQGSGYRATGAIVALEDSKSPGEALRATKTSPSIFATFEKANTCAKRTFCQEKSSKN